MNLMNRHSQHSFAQIPDVRIPRSKFNRSFTVKDSFDFDYLTPVFWDEIIPGDTHHLTVQAFVRLATQITPIMDNMYLDFFFFFVPNRLTWDNWEKFNGAQDNPGDSTDFICPQLTPGSAFTAGSIFDKYGLPIGVANVSVLNTLMLRSYIKIYNDWFRDQNMIDSVVLPTDDGPDVQSDFTLQKRGKRHDYFTSALPFAQKGPAVTLSLGTSAPINVGGQAYALWKGSTSSTVGAQITTSGGAQSAGVDVDSNVVGGNAGNWSNGEALEPNNWFADLSSASAGTINELRLAIMTQSLLELDARGGTRYVEILRSHFGVISPDFRLQRAEFLGGGSLQINSHAVPQTSPTSGGAAQATLAAFSTGMAGQQNGIGFSKSFVEHGYVIGLMCARADITYQQGVHRGFLKSTRFDFFWPKLQEAGEQALTNQEIYAQGSSTPDNEVFGYQERYAEYRYRPSEIHGELRSTFSTPLDMWHMAEEFGSPPSLNQTFIEQSTPISRAIAVNADNYGSNELIGDFSFNYISARPMTTYANPATLGRF